MVLNKQEITTEKEYRALKTHINYSALKDFDKSRAAFYKEYILGEPRKRKEGEGIIVGTLLHFLLCHKDGSIGPEFDKQFHILSTPKPGGQIGELCDNLITRTFKTLVINGDGTATQQDTFDTLFEDAVQWTKYNANGQEINFKGKDTEKILELFNKSGIMYYDEIMHTVGKTTVSKNQVEKAERLFTKLKEHPYSAKYVNVESGHLRDVYNEFPIIFNMQGIDYKCMLDRLVVDHDKKVITSLDWKTSWSTDDEDDIGSTYLKLGYYIQAGLYYYAVSTWAKCNKLEDYNIKPMTYVFVDSATGFNDPTIVNITMDDIERAWRGFYVSGRKYNGITEIVNELLWCLDKGIWTTTKQIFDNGGETSLRIKYGSR
jgi:hypothetical protein